MKAVPKFYRIGLRYPKTVLTVSLFLTLVSLWIAKDLKIETSMTAMAPQSLESVRAEKEYQQAFGSNSHLVVVIEDRDPEVAERFSDELANRIGGLPGVDYVDYKRPVEYFKKRLWLYLDLEDLKEIRHRVAHALKLEKKGVSPVFSDLMDFADTEDRSDLTFRDIFKKYEQKYGSSAKYAASEEGDLILLRVKLKDEVGEGERTRRLIDEVRGIDREMRKGDPFQKVEVGYTGTAQATIEESDQIKEEMAWVSAIVTGVLVLILFLYFRRIQAILLVGLPLIAGVVWTGGIVYLLLGHLNLVTSFAGAILAGIGSDYGIYLLSRYYLERERGADFQTACRLAFEKTGTATWGSMVTTVGAFAVLFLSHFGVFFEFGLLGVLGVLLNYVAMVIVLPALLIYLGDSRGVGKKRFSLIPNRFFSRESRLFLKRPITVICGAALLIFIGSFCLPQGGKIHFEEDMMVNKRLPANRVYEKMGRIQTGPVIAPTILLTRGINSTEETVDRLDRLVRQDTEHKLVFANVVGRPSFFPKQTEEKKRLLVETKQMVLALRLLPRKFREEFVSSLEDSIHAEPVTAEGLPKEVRRAFESPFRKDVFATYLFPSFDRLSAELLKHYHDEIAALQKKTGLNFTVVDSTFVYDDILQLISRETPRGVALVCLFLGIVLLMISRSPVRTGIVMAQLLGSLVLLLAVLLLTGIRLNVINIASIPIILGTGIDSFIHFAQRYDESGDMTVALREKVPAILFSNLTTMVGFGGLLFTSNPGLRSVGWVAVPGLGLVTLVCIFVFPRSLILRSR